MPSTPALDSIIAALQAGTQTPSTPAPSNDSYVLTSSLNSKLATKANLPDLLSLAQITKDSIPVEPINFGYGPGDAPSDITNAINQAIEYSNSTGRPLKLRGVKNNGVVIPWITTGGHEIYARQVIEGEGENTRVKLADGSNKHVFMTKGAGDYFSPTANADADFPINLPVIAPVIRRLNIDGNSTKNTAGSGLVIIGWRPIIEDVNISNTACHGLVSSFRDDAVNEDYVYSRAMEGHFTRVRVYASGRSGWDTRGPHDCNVRSFYVINASQASSGTWPAVRWRSGATGITGSGMNGRIYDMHTYTDGSGVGQGIGFLLEQDGVEIFGSHFEGSYVCNLDVRSNGNSFEGIQCYALRSGPWNVCFRGTNNKLDAFLGGLDGSSTYGGILFSGTAINNEINLRGGDQAGGFINFNGNSSGGNKIRAKGSHLLGGNQPVQGAPNIYDDVDIDLSVSTTIDSLGRYRLAQLGKMLSYRNNVSANGTTVGQASQLDALNTRITGGSGGGVALPPTTRLSNENISVINNSGGVITIYPFNGEALLTGNASLANGACALFKVLDKQVLARIS